MVILSLIVIIGIPIFLVAAKVILFAFWLSSDAFSRIPNIFLRILSGFAFIAASGVVSVPISLALQPLLPDWRVQGDGGVGMAYNVLSVAALYAATPCVLMLLTAFALSRTTGPRVAIADDIRH